MRRHILERLKEVFSIDHRSLRLYRVVFSVILIIDILTRAQSLEMLYSQVGVNPIKLGGSYNIFNFFYLFENQYLIALQFTLGIISSFLFMFGIFPRLNSVFIWYFYNSLNIRNGLVLHSAEDIMRVLTFWNLFLPFGFRQKKIFSFASFGIISQILCIYIGVMSKRDYRVWVTEASAMQTALESYPIISSLGNWLNQFPDLLKALSRIGYFFELIVPPLVLIPFYNKRFKLTCSLLMVAFHFGIFLLFNLSTFAFVGMMMWSLFLPDIFWKYDFSKKFLAILPPGDYSFSPDFFSNVFVRATQKIVMIIALLYVFTSLTTHEVLQKKGFFPLMATRPLLYIHRNMGIYQTWIMFTPGPSYMSTWHQLISVDKNGAIKDLLTGKAPTQDKPKDVGDLYRNFPHWRYTFALTSDLLYHKEIHANYLHYYCKLYPESVRIDLNYVSAYKYKEELRTSLHEFRSYDCINFKLLPDKLKP